MRPPPTYFPLPINLQIPVFLISARIPLRHSPVFELANMVSANLEGTRSFRVAYASEERFTEEMLGLDLRTKSMLVKGFDG